MATWDIGAVQREGSATDIGAVQAAAVAPSENSPTSHLAGPLWGPLAGPIFCLFGIIVILIKRLI